ncbi:TPA: hypothetical protein N0F65_007797 [Lagenidium giganteum]|uniref:Integrator complex subunit 4/Protein SIEL C-terminal Ig-like domain-containing protein n=1 Tax=Lagenidium giganteum TaxID=4803 RepID=A0AAV2Z0K9_9STRA|nr:TPA: hypothetical protein N0F65_007797 [Lagenidium giganteum]
MKRELDAMTCASSDGTATPPAAFIEEDNVVPPSKRVKPDLSLAATDDALPLPEDPVPGVVHHPMKVLGLVRDQLMTAVDAHLQAKLLLEYSQAAIAPNARTDSAIDFLFSYLQQHQEASASGKNEQASARGSNSTGGGNSNNAGNTGGAIVVGAIVRGLRKLLMVKPRIVEPMIQVDAMGEQLMQCMSVAEDCKLRRDMICIVLDCLFITNKFQQAETLLTVCINDHDENMQRTCARAYQRLHDSGRGFTTTPALFERFIALLLYGAHPQTRVCGARLLAAIARTDVHPNVKTLAVVADTGLDFGDYVFLLLCTGASDQSVIVRAEIAQLLRQLPSPSNTIVHHVLQKAPQNEEIVDMESKSVMMASSGMLLSLLEDQASEVVAASSGAIRVHCDALVDDALDRVIPAHFDRLCAGELEEELHLTLLANTHRLLEKRAQGPAGKFPITEEQLLLFIAHHPTRTSAIALGSLKILMQCAVPITLSDTIINTFSLPRRDLTYESEGSTLNETLAKLHDVYSHQTVEVEEDRSAAINDAIASSKRFQWSLPVHRQDISTSKTLKAKFLASVSNPPSKNEVARYLKSIRNLHGQPASEAQRLVAKLLEVVLMCRREPTALEMCEQGYQTCGDLVARLPRFEWKIQVELNLMRLGFRLGMALKDLENCTLGQLNGLIAGVYSEIGRLQRSRALPDSMIMGPLSSATQLRARLTGFWQTCWPETLISWVDQRQTLKLTHAMITNPGPGDKESHEVSSQWPFKLNVCATITDLRNPLQLCIRTRSPNGTMASHPVPLKSLRWKRPGSYALEHQISIMVTPFSDPCNIAISLCLRAPSLDLSGHRSENYVAISQPASCSVFYRASSVSRQSSRS